MNGALSSRRGAGLRRRRPASPPDEGRVALVTCMDFRVMDAIADYMNRRSLTDRYDHVVLAGASLGAQSSRFPAWSQTFWEHLALLNRNRLGRVIIIDHRDCGAYKEILGPTYAKTRDAETQVHARHLRALHTEIGKRYPGVPVELVLMDLDGSTETVTPS